MRCQWAVACVLSLLATGPVAFAQEVKKDEVTIPTVDGVDLKGTFYPSTEGRKSPCVMMIHRWGADRTKGDWGPLAESLQAQGFSVLMFDLRGHGKSKDLRDKQEFWNLFKYPYNRASGGDQRVARIDAAKFRPAYFPWLINDIAAARKFLDEKNDAGECNSGRIFIIAERDMATLALLWTASEYRRFGIAPTLANPQPTHLAGSDVSGIVMLSPTRKPLGLTMPYDTAGGKRMLFSGDLSLGETLKQKQSLCVIHGATDPSGSSDAKFIFDGLFDASKVAKAEQIKYLVPVKDTKLSGVELLGKKQLDVEKSIMDYLGEVKNRGIGNNWVTRDVNKMPFVAVPLVDQLGFPAVK